MRCEGAPTSSFRADTRAIQAVVRKDSPTSSRRRDRAGGRPCGGLGRNAMLVWWLARSARARRLGDRDSPGLVFLAARWPRRAHGGVGRDRCRSRRASPPTSGRKTVEVGTDGRLGYLPLDKLLSGTGRGSCLYLGWIARATALKLGSRRASLDNHSYIQGLGLPIPR